MQLDKNGAKDVMRANPWKPLSDAQKTFVEELKLQGNAMSMSFQGSTEGPSEENRLWALARTHLELAVMLAVKAATTETENASEE